MRKNCDLQLVIPHVDDIEFLVCHVALLWRRLIYSAIKPLGISGIEKRVLYCISHHPGATQVQIANLVDLEPQNLLRSLDKLEKNNWIRKETDCNDRRIKCLFITKEAKTIMAKIDTISDQIRQKILANISTNQQQLISETLNKIRENLLQNISTDKSFC